MKNGKTRGLAVLGLCFACAVILMQPVSAGSPTVSGVIIWSDGANTILNVTVAHTPQTSLHYLDRVEVNIDGDNRVFPVAYRPEIGFVVQCDLGVIEAPANATVRAHCNIDGYSLTPYGPVLVPELAMLFLPLFVAATILCVIVRPRAR